MPYYETDTVTLHHGDSLTTLPTLPDRSVDAVITDPPYEIGIASHSWDSTGIAYNVNLWRECWRVLKPGGHLIAFGAPRTYHRLASAIEDAGLHIVDQLDWIYTHGKPKGIDLARAIDRHRDDRPQVLQVTAWLKAARDAAGWTTEKINHLFGFHARGQATHWTTHGVAAAIPTPAQWDRLITALGADDSTIRHVVEDLWARKGTVGEAFGTREIVSQRHETARTTSHYQGYSGHRVKARAASADARRWEGWHTAIRPAHDPIVLARKPTGYDTLTAGVLRHGVGGLHTAACTAAGGGWPTNILIGHDCPDGGPCADGCPVRDLGAAAASFPIFRLESRTPAAERIQVDGVTHPTPKPVALMRWLVRLVTPPAGLILDPFAGSGTTLEAAVLEGARGVGVEQHEPYAALCRARLDRPLDLPLFTA
ncbi:DNA-methyltransferase [Kitasatospora sp. NPDC058406]|uniref:DNA-methyltransferase n=1 Tax=Kitasatospora sp. NPDC058406 TaxID=3346483 RepID=UPI0036697275